MAVIKAGAHPQIKTVFNILIIDTVPSCFLCR
jgi:hypothetical protein